MVTLWGNYEGISQCNASLVASFMGLILTTALVLQQITTGFSMALAAGLQQLTFMGVYVVPGEVFAGAQQFADELLLAMI